MLDERNRPRSRCIRCGTCDGHPCLVNAKSDAHVVCIEPALDHPNVTLLTNAYVSRLETSASGREVTRVVVERGDQRESYSADIVVSSCGAINSAALLLRSVSDQHPRGLANGSDVVGRHYMGHINSVLMALSRCPNPTIFQKSLAVNDFYFGSPEWDHPMGHISFVGKLDGVTLSAGAPAIAPGWTLELMGKHSLDFWLTSEDLPDPENRVTLDREGKIVLAYTPNNGEGHRRLVAKLESLMQQQRACQIHGHECHQGLFSRNLFVGQRIPLAGVAHQNGTIRFGDDPATSALDRNCRAHEVDNLYVVDGSFFPSSGAVNPALTIMANALRVGDHILERLGAKASARRRRIERRVSGGCRALVMPARSLCRRAPDGPGRDPRRGSGAGSDRAALGGARHPGARGWRCRMAPRGHAGAVTARAEAVAMVGSRCRTWIVRSTSTPACSTSSRSPRRRSPGPHTSSSRVWRAPGSE